MDDIQSVFFIRQKKKISSHYRMKYRHVFGLFSGYEFSMKDG
jgi:hypothetical protein